MLSFRRNPIFAPQLTPNNYFIGVFVWETAEAAETTPRATTTSQ
jgi:hypothetical protein